MANAKGEMLESVNRPICYIGTRTNRLWVRIPFTPLMKFNYHLIELKYRIIYISFSIGLSWIIAIYYVPLLLDLSPIYFLNNRFENALYFNLLISFFISLICTLPFLLWNVLKFIQPALYEHEYLRLKWIISPIIIFFYFGLLISPIIIWKLPIFNIYYHSDNIYLTPQLEDLLDIIIDYFLSLFILLLVPLLGIKNRKFLYLFGILIATLFTNTFLIILLIILITEFFLLYFAIIL